MAKDRGAVEGPTFLVFSSVLPHQSSTGVSAGGEERGEGWEASFRPAHSARPPQKQSMIVYLNPDS